MPGGDGTGPMGQGAGTGRGMGGCPPGMVPVEAIIIAQSPKRRRNRHGGAMERKTRNTRRDRTGRA